jgi:hypothetical protein
MRHPRLPGAFFRGQLVDAPGSGAGVGRSEVAHDRDAVFEAAAQDRPHHRLQQRCVAALWALAALELCQGEGPLGQHLEDQHAWAAPRDERVPDRPGGVCPVACETRRTPDRQRVVLHPCS